MPKLFAKAPRARWGTRRMPTAMMLFAAKVLALPRRPTSEIFIAGSTESEQFNKVANDDIFLLTIDTNGDQKSFEIFGVGWDDGHVVQANIDLVITHDCNALILANTMSFTNDPSAEVYSFLIERYDTITDQCEYKVVKADWSTYHFPGYDGSAESIEVSYQAENMEAVGREECNKERRLGIL